MGTLSKVSQVEYIAKLRRGSPFPSSRGLPGAVQLAQGHPGWLFSQEAQWGNRTPNLWLHSQTPNALSYPGSWI